MAGHAVFLGRLAQFLLFPVEQGLRREFPIRDGRLGLLGKGGESNYFKECKGAGGGGESCGALNIHEGEARGFAKGVGKTKV